MWTMLGGDVGMPMTILVCADAEPGSVKPTAVSITKAPKVLRMFLLQIFVFARYPASSGDTKPESAILPDHTHKNNEERPVIRLPSRAKTGFDPGKWPCLIALPRDTFGLHNHG
jgi:hypothetical protein